MSRDRTHGGRPVIAVLAMMVVALASCGDSAEGGPDASDVDSPTSTSEAPAQSGTDAPESDDDEASSDAEAGTHRGTVTIGSDSYNFRVDENGQCLPDFLGQGIFRALMHQIDNDGNSVPLGDGSGRGGLTLSVVIDEDLDSPDAQSLMNVRTADNWMAMVSMAGSRIDTVQINGNQASGTATFVNEAGDQTQSGTFNIECADG